MTESHHRPIVHGQAYFSKFVTRSSSDLCESPPQFWKIRAHVAGLVGPLGYQATESSSDSVFCSCYTPRRDETYFPISRLPGPCKQICVEMERTAAMRTHLKKKDQILGC
jgi:hypothetical protein